MFTVTFYSHQGKNSPIEEYLDKCDDRLRAKILRQLKYVQEFGLTPSIPNLKKLTNTPFWELRILGRDNIRIVCVNLPGKKVMVLHVFSKKKDKTPRRELDIALNRYRDLTNDIF